MLDAQSHQKREEAVPSLARRDVEVYSALRYMHIQLIVKEDEYLQKLLREKQHSTMIETIPDETMVTDRLALSRAQHLKCRDTRVKSVSDDEVDGGLSDWSESDRECCPLSDFESTSNTDGNLYDLPFDDDDDEEENHLHRGLLRDSTLLENVLRLNNSNTSTLISFTSDGEKPKEQQQLQERTLHLTDEKPPIPIRKQAQAPLLPARRLPNRQGSPRRSITTSHILPPPTTNLLRSRKTITASPARFSLHRETTSTNLSFNGQLIKDSSLSPNSSFHSHDENQPHQRQTVSPNLSQISNVNAPVPRVYELKKLFLDDHDYGRLTDVTVLKPIPPRNRQKWGTIVHPPFPLGYQQITSEQVTQAVERLASPVRCRDRHTPVQTPSKRYLSVEETDALISRLTKVKPLRSSDQYWPIQRQSRPVKSFTHALKTTNNWKGVGISA